MRKYTTIMIFTVFGVVITTVFCLPRQQRLCFKEFLEKSTIAVTGRNVYVAWHTNNTVNGNEEVFFRASNDGGKTFDDIVYLSHTVSSNSTRIEIDSDGDIVAVQWWESNKTDDVPAMRISNDYGETFGPTLKLSKNGTIDEEGG
jgi:hypothetical protein